MDFGVMLLHSANKNNDPDLDKKCQAVLDRIGLEMGAALSFLEEASFIRQGFPCFFIGSGGCESWFLSISRQMRGPYYLLTTDNQNSLAAAMEILAYLQAHGERGRSCMAVRRRSQGLFGRFIWRTRRKLGWPPCGWVSLGMP